MPSYDSKLKRSLKLLGKGTNMIQTQKVLEFESGVEMVLVLRV